MIDRVCISINSKCNLNCKYCHFGDKMNFKNSEQFEFSNYEIDKIIDNLINYINDKKIPLFKIGIVGSGEPLLNYSTIVEIIEKIKVSNVFGKIVLYTITNGTLLTDDKLDYFYENKDIISLNFSLDGYKDLHEVMRSNYDKTYENILKYEQVFGEKPLINCVVTKKTIENRDEVIKYFTEYNFKKINFSILFDVNNDELTITNQVYNSFLEECNNAGIAMRQRKNCHEKIYDCAKYGRLCGVGKTNIFITKNGIFPCGRFMNNERFKLTNFDVNLFEVEEQFQMLKSVPDGECYYDFNKVGGYSL